MKILVAIDGSRCSEAAVQAICTRPWPAGSEVELITAIHAPIIPDPFLIGVIVYEEIIEKQRKAVPPLLKKAAERIREQASDLKVTTKIVRGSPKEVIVDEAERWGADLVLVGSHGHGPVRRFALGSVSLAVAIHAPCSVEIVRDREPREKTSRKKR